MNSIPILPMTHVCGQCGQQWVGTHFCGAIGLTAVTDPRDAEIHRLLDEVTRLERENEELRTTVRTLRGLR